MYSTQVGIFQETSQVVFGGLLQCLDRVHLEAQIVYSIGLCYLMHQVHKGPPTDQELGTLLILTYLMESHCPQPVPLGPLQPPFMKFFVEGPSPYAGPDMAGLYTYL